jgi:hypothetical protein
LNSDTGRVELFFGDSMLIKRDGVSFRKTKHPFLRQTTQILMLCVFVYKGRIGRGCQGNSTMMERHYVRFFDSRIFEKKQRNKD